ncbi:MAG: alpha-E domain-containing protein [Acidimicrobiales bacterium]|jgi:uncharacterized alpha-E superfamily protein|nr:alpha-E domain-containing protein [Acidimicrobiales bacterium]
MLLSRTAEAVYWVGRYLERAEATARVLSFHTELFLDLPRAAGLRWEPLLAVTGSSDTFEEAYGEADEASVVTFLAVDMHNQGSVLASLAQARENMRTTRPVFPRSAWEAVNSLYLRSGDGAAGVCHRGHRHEWLQGIIADLQRLTGLLEGHMCHDEAYAFLRVGRHLERADMTTRVLDVRAASLVSSPSDMRPYAEAQWSNLLRTLTGYQIYRRNVSSRVRGREVLRFALQDPRFPRSVEYCLTQMAHGLLELPNHDRAMADCAAAQRLIEDAKVADLPWEHLHDYVDELQLQLGRIDERMAGTYFRAPVSSPTVLLATA